MRKRAFKKKEVFPFLSCSGRQQEGQPLPGQWARPKRRPEPGEVLCAYLCVVARFPGPSWTYRRTKACLRHLPQSAGGFQLLVCEVVCGAPGSPQEGSGQTS